MQSEIKDKEISMKAPAGLQPSRLKTAIRGSYNKKHLLTSSP